MRGLVPSSPTRFACQFVPLRSPKVVEFETVRSKSQRQALDARCRPTDSTSGTKMSRTPPGCYRNPRRWCRSIRKRCLEMLYMAVVSSSCHVFRVEARFESEEWSASKQQRPNSWYATCRPAHRFTIRCPFSQACSHDLGSESGVQSRCCEFSSMLSGCKRVLEDVKQIQEVSFTVVGLVREDPLGPTYHTKAPSEACCLYQNS